MPVLDDYERLRLLLSIDGLLGLAGRRHTAARALVEALTRDQARLGVDLAAVAKSANGADAPTGEAELTERLLTAESWPKLRKALARAAQKLSDAGPDALARNAAALAEAAGLTADDALILETFARIAGPGGLSVFADAVTEAGGLRPAEVLAALSGVDAEHARVALRDGRFAAAGVLRPVRDRRPSSLGYEMPHAILTALSPPSDGRKDLERVLLGPPQRAALRLDDFTHLDPDADLLQDLLRNAAANGARGVNLLLYGAPGAGKSELARTLAETAGLTLYSVGETDSDLDEPSRWERMQALMLAQRLTAGRRDAVLLFEEMEDLFEEGGPVDWAGSSYVKARSKVFFNRLLEENPTPIIWTTNSAGRFDPAVLRRMTYALELSTPPAPVRERMWSQRLTAAGLNVDPGAAARLAARMPAPAGLAANAVRAGALAGRGLDGVEQAAIGLARALGLPRASADSLAEFDARLINADSNVAALADQAARSRDPRGLSLLLYGPPGTGKSACARWFASRLGLEPLYKRASDLLSKWVGETEQNIARAFEEARRSGAFLILDEADSFLHQRVEGQQRWEVSEVNEMLTQMESHELPFACTTNFHQLVDGAALRRFTFKIRLDPLTREQRRLAFRQFFAIEPPPEVDALDNLTPGDFAVVRRKLAFLIDAAGDPHALARMLAQESAAKPGARRAWGFEIGGGRDG